MNRKIIRVLTRFIHFIGRDFGVSPRPEQGKLFTIASEGVWTRAP